MKRQHKVFNIYGAFTGAAGDYKLDVPIFLDFDAKKVILRTVQFLYEGNGADIACRIVTPMINDNDFFYLIAKDTAVVAAFPLIATPQAKYDILQPVNGTITFRFVDSNNANVLMNGKLHMCIEFLAD